MVSMLASNARLHISSAGSNAGANPNADMTMEIQALNTSSWLMAFLLIASLIACKKPAPESRPSQGAAAPYSMAAEHQMIAIPSGPFVSGSTLAEREAAYAAYEKTSGNQAAKKWGWFDHELAPATRNLNAFGIDRTTVTMNAYAEFITHQSIEPPTMDASTWAKLGFSQDFDTEVKRFVWSSHVPPPGRGQQPVVLVTAKQAEAYCQWRGQLVGTPRRLPTALEFERASRGTTGSIYPWGDHFDPSKLNSGVHLSNLAPTPNNASNTISNDLVSADAFKNGASPDGVLQMAGNVFQWTSSAWPYEPTQRTVKGSAWEDFGGLGRGASQHGRPPSIRHAIIGFRCAGN